jgi:hypothetical protein
MASSFQLEPSGLLARLFRPTFRCFLLQSPTVWFAFGASLPRDFLSWLHSFGGSSDGFPLGVSVFRFASGASLPREFLCVCGLFSSFATLARSRSCVEHRFSFGSSEVAFQFLGAPSPFGGFQGPQVTFQLSSPFPSVLHCSLSTAFAASRKPAITCRDSLLAPLLWLAI